MDMTEKVGKFKENTPSSLTFISIGHKYLWKKGKCIIERKNEEGKAKDKIIISILSHQNSPIFFKILW